MRSFPPTSSLVSNMQRQYTSVASLHIFVVLTRLEGIGQLHIINSAILGVICWNWSWEERKRKKKYRKGERRLGIIPVELRKIQDFSGFSPLGVSVLGETGTRYSDGVQFMSPDALRQVLQRPFTKKLGFLVIISQAAVIELSVKAKTDCEVSIYTLFVLSAQFLHMYRETLKTKVSLRKSWFQAGWNQLKVAQREKRWTRPI